MYSNQYCRSACCHFLLTYGLGRFVWVLHTIPTRPRCALCSRKIPTPAPHRPPNTSTQSPHPCTIPQKISPTLLLYSTTQKTDIAVGPEGTYVCPSRVCLQEPVSTSHSLMVQSRLADAIVVPSSLINTAETQCLQSAQKFSTQRQTRVAAKYSSILTRGLCVAL